MDTRQFLAELPTLWDGDPQVADHPRDRRFGEVIEVTQGMATENKLALLNLAARCLDPAELYLEIGTWTGCSILGASLGNHARFVTVDDFSQFGGELEQFHRNADRFGRADIQLVNDDAWKVLASPPFTDPVGVYFYDGGHTFDDQWRALELAEPLLADEALVIVDDTARPQVRGANASYTRHRPQFELVCRFHSPYNSEPRWWNGVEVYTFHRSRGPGRSPSSLSVRGARLRARAERRWLLTEARAKREYRRVGRIAGKVRHRFSSWRSG